MHEKAGGRHGPGEAGWDRSTLELRIANVEARVRHAGGSPDDQELAAYEVALKGLDPQGTVVVLGMTPELRRLTLRLFRRVEVVDCNRAAIELYRGWVEPSERERERVVEGDWMQLGRLVSALPEAVLGDGVFGNLPDEEAHGVLLGEVRRVLAPGGRLVTRMAMIPEGFDEAKHCAEVLVRRFRAGELDEAEFGFGMRLVGHCGSCYDRGTCELDNARLFAECDAAFGRGEYTEREHAAIQRYRFGGRNCILAQGVWEGLLGEAGFGFVQRRCVGKAWYEYYVVYECAVR